jgi:hypothetical protein
MTAHAWPRVLRYSEVLSMNKNMESILNSLESQFGITLSETFRDFWAAYLVDVEHNFKFEPITLRKGKFADIAFEEGNRWSIRVSDELPAEGPLFEVSLAHEVLHWVLYREGFPAFCHEGSASDETLMLIDAAYSILTHPIISYRMQEWGFPVEISLRSEVAAAIELIEKTSDPNPDDPFSILSWILTYVLNRFDQGDQVADLIAHRVPHVAFEGDRYVSWLMSQGYDKPQNVTPQLVIEIAGEFLRMIDLDRACCICVMEDENWIPVSGINN